jgi:hypothetical protein
MIHLPSPAARAADDLYRRFFLAGIAATLTAGAGWGALLLLRIASERSFTALSIFEVNAHGQAQIYGWVGLFVLGFTYRTLPRFRGVGLAWPHLARASFALMVAGLAVRAVAEPLHAAGAGWRAAALAGGAAEAAAVGCFAAVVAATLRRSPGRLAASDLYVLAAAGWFAAAGLLDVFHLQRTLAAPDREALLAQVAVFQFPLRDLQIHGLAMMMIFGVSLRIAPGLFGAREPGRRLAAGLWLPLQLAVAGEAAAFIAFLTTRNPRWAAAMAAATLLLAVSATLFVLNLKLFARVERPDRSLKFLRAGHVWLVLSLLMLVAAPAWSRLTGIPFSHAWYGATRHAVTVGFITLTILGVAARVVPAFRGFDTARLPALWAPFALINAGCALRVGMQVATDLAPGAFPIAGASGLLELAGLALWGGHLARLLLTRPAVGSTVPTRAGVTGEPAPAAHPPATASPTPVGGAYPAYLGHP